MAEATSAELYKSERRTTVVTSVIFRVVYTRTGYPLSTDDRSAMSLAVQAVRRWGNSRAVVISKRVQSQLSWALREVIHVSVEDDAIVLRPVRFQVGSDKPPKQREFDHGG